MLEITGLKFGLAIEQISKNYLTEHGIVKLYSVFHKKTTFCELQLDWKELKLSLHASDYFLLSTLECVTSLSTERIMQTWNLCISQGSSEALLLPNTISTSL